MVQEIIMTFLGLRLSVPAFQTGALNFPGGSVEALPRREQFLVLNLKTRTLHTLSRSIGEADVVLARIETSATEVTVLEKRAPILPHTRLPRTLEKLAMGAPLKVHCFGSSLVANGDNTDGWQRLLFDRASPVDQILVSPTVDYTSYGVGGTNSRYTISLIGEGRENDRRLRTPAYACDLAIVALLPNDGEDRLAIYEGVVRMFRERGVEVLLLTDNAYAGVGEDSPLWNDGEFVRCLAETYGCALADTAAYMREAELRGTVVYGDTIHQTAAGHWCWAQAAGGALTPLSLAPASTRVTTGCLEDSALIPASALVDFTPATTGGWPNPSTPGNHPALVFSASIAGSTDLEAGASVEIDESGMLAADLIFDACEGFTAEVRLRGQDAILKTISYEVPERIPPSRPQTLAVFTAIECGNATVSQFRVTVSQGKLVLYAVAYQYLEARGFFAAL